MLLTFPLNFISKTPRFSRVTYLQEDSHIFYFFLDWCQNDSRFFLLHKQIVVMISDATKHSKIKTLGHCEDDPTQIRLATIHTAGLLLCPSLSSVLEH